MAHHIRRRLLASTLLAAVASVASAAHAQDAAAVPAPPASAPADDQSIIVTGSRIQRADLQSAVPLNVVSTQQIQQTGAGNIQDVLALLPAVGQNTSRSTTNFSNTGQGTATINLRNLGSSRTLVLINGRRSVGLPGSSAFDVNNIPTDFIERVDVVTGGASAVYGSEAVAGVVNFILKDKFTGVEAHAQAGVSDKGDAARQTASLLAGFKFGPDDNGHFVGNFTYDNDHGLRSRDRTFSAVDNPSRSSYASQGLFSLDDAFSARNGMTYTFDGNNKLKPYQGANVDGYNREQDRYLAVPVQRYQAAFMANYQFSDMFNLYAEGEYNRTSSNAKLEALAVANEGPGAAVNFDGSALAGIPITSPYVPAALRAAAIAAGVDTIDFRRRSNDIFSRSNTDVRDYYRGVIGLKGEIASGWRYDASFEHSQVRDHTFSGQIFARNYGAALNNVLDASGNVVCADPAARAAGCAPINIFGFNTVSAAAAKWLQTDPGAAFGGITAGAPVTFDYLAHTKQDVGSLTFTGNLFSLWGGPVAVAFGGEYRHESSSEVYDPYTQAGLSEGNQISNTVGRFNVKEGFVEVDAPIVERKPWLYYLGLEGAARYASYSTVGGVWSWKAGGQFAPIADVRFRAAYAQATRAPNIGELFSSQSQTFPAIVDPCDQGGGDGDAATKLAPLSATCAAIPGIAKTVAKSGSFAYTTSQIQTIDGLTGGNLNLKQETADTITAGVAFAPHQIPGLSLTVDYYHIKVKNAVGIIGQQVSADECIATGNPLFCDNVIRNPNTGYITRVNAINLNVGSYLVAGIDTEARYQTHLTFGENTTGVLFDVRWTRLLKQQQTPFAGADPQKEIGQADCYQCGRLGTGFRNKVYGSLTLTPGRFSLNYNIQYLSPVVDNLSDGADALRIPAYFYHSIQMSYTIGDQRHIEFYGGVNNLTDKTPPITGDTNQVTWPGTETVADTYDLYGRMLYAGVRVKF